MTVTPTGFPPQRTQAVLRELLVDLRATGDTRRKEAVTGRLEDPAAARGGRLREPLAIERDLAEIRGYRETIALAETRAGTTQRVLDTLRESVDELANQAELARQNAAKGGRETASALAEDLLGTVVSALNTRIGGRSLFAGDAGDAPALVEAERIRDEVIALVAAAPDAATAEADVRAAFDTPGGLFETTLYQGGTGDAPSAEIAEGERVALSARADDPAIRDLLRSVALLSAAEDPALALAEADRKALFEGALADLRNVTDPLNRRAAEIGAGEARVEQAKARHIAAQTALTAQYNEMTGADSLVAAAELSAVESQIEVLFLTTARLQDLSLVNFLR